MLPVFRAVNRVSEVNGQNDFERIGTISSDGHVSASASGDSVRIVTAECAVTLLNGQAWSSKYQSKNYISIRKEYRHRREGLNKDE